MKNHYKLLILDYGGVYSFQYDVNCIDTIVHNTFGIIPNVFQKERIAEYSQLLGANKISSKHYVASVAKILQVEEPVSTIDFEESTVSFTHPPSSEMKTLVKFVKKNNIAVSLLSDMYMFEVIKTRSWGRYEGFDYVAFSAELGVTKHEPRFFRDTLRHFEVQPDEALFVDDNLANIKIASDMGVHVLHANKTIYANAKQLTKDIMARLGLHAGGANT